MHRDDGFGPGQLRALQNVQAHTTSANDHHLASRLDLCRVDDSADTGGRLVRFGGDWVGQQLSQAEYTTLFNEADAGYARMLRALLTEVN